MAMSRKQTQHLQAREKSAATILYICHPTLEILLEL